MNLPEPASMSHPEIQNYLMWCSDDDFLELLFNLDSKGLIALIQHLQGAMAVEQGTFDLLTRQLESRQGNTSSEKLGEALFFSQARLARLYARSRQCFAMQSSKTKGEEVGSGQTWGCDKDEGSITGESFQQSLQFFQKAARDDRLPIRSLVSHNVRPKSHMCDWGPVRSHPHQPSAQDNYHRYSLNSEVLVPKPKRNTKSISGDLTGNLSVNGLTGHSDVTPSNNPPAGVRGGPSGYSLRDADERDKHRNLLPDSNGADSESVYRIPRRRPLVNLNVIDDKLNVKPNRNITRTQSFRDGLNEPEPENTLYRAISYTDGIDSPELQKVRQVGSSYRKSSLRRAPSVDEILESVKVLRAKRKKSNMVKSNPNIACDMNLLAERSKCNVDIEHVYERIQSTGRGGKYVADPQDLLYENVTDDYLYENVNKTSNQQRVIEISANSYLPGGTEYANIHFPFYSNVGRGLHGGPTYVADENVYENVMDSKIISNGSVGGVTYDVPKSATHIYDLPQKPRPYEPPTCETEGYDVPSLIPKASKILLEASNLRRAYEDCDRDSLDGERGNYKPEIPSPDYSSEEEDFKSSKEDCFSGDEGLGESDCKTYVDDPGLEVILEEPEEEYVSSGASELGDSERIFRKSQRKKIRYGSLDGSEGIGSVEGDTNSSGGSTHGEEDTSSGVHSDGPGSPIPRCALDKEEKEDKTQKDRLVEVYNETLRQRNLPKIKEQNGTRKSVTVKVQPLGQDFDLKTCVTVDDEGTTKFLPSVKALRHQFEAPKILKTEEVNDIRRKMSMDNLESSRQMNGPTRSVSRRSLDCDSISSVASSIENLVINEDLPIQPIFTQFEVSDPDDCRSKYNTKQWNPKALLQALYHVPEPSVRRDKSVNYINIEGYLEKLPSGRRKATFWNAWKKRYFKAKDGFLYYYANNQTVRPSLALQLMGGKIDTMDQTSSATGEMAHPGNVLGIDDGKGHYIVVKCLNAQEAEKWRSALESHTQEDFSSTYCQPVAIPKAISVTHKVVIIDLGSCSVRAGILCDHPTLPWIFFPNIVAADQQGNLLKYGMEALAPEVRSNSTLLHPVKPSSKITKYQVDVAGIRGILTSVFKLLNLDPAQYDVQLSVSRNFNMVTQAQIVRVLFDDLNVQSVNMTHQTVLSLCSYNATSGVVVDIGDRMDIVPVVEGYIVDSGVSRIPYGGSELLQHLRHFLHQKHYNLVTEVESYVIRYVLENTCYCTQYYNTELARCQVNPESVERSLNISEFFDPDINFYDVINLDCGRFQVTEGLFNPSAWGLDNLGIPKLVQKAIQECGVDLRKEMARNIFVSGGVTLLPGFVDRLSHEVDKLTPLALTTKVHASPYRYHAAYLGACILASSEAFQHSKITSDEWSRTGPTSVRKWKC